MQYREATTEDAPQIAALHAQSWQQAYRGILRDEFLDGPVLQDRASLWQRRLSAPPDNLFVLLALENQNLCGFVSVLGNDDPVWGALIDNLHVHPLQKGQGLGAQLMHKAAEWIKRRDSTGKFYLWVYEANLPARRFYEKLGGVNSERVLHENPGGGSAYCLRYTWM